LLLSVPSLYHTEVEVSYSSSIRSS
jgi:hypothetical protein